MLNKNHVLFNDLCRKYYIRFWEQICQLLKKGELQFVPEVQIHFKTHFTSRLRVWAGRGKNKKTFQDWFCALISRDKNSKNNIKKIVKHNYSSQS